MKNLASLAFVLSVRFAALYAAVLAFEDGRRALACLALVCAHVAFVRLSWVGSVWRGGSWRYYRL